MTRKRLTTAKTKKQPTSFEVVQCPMCKSTAMEVGETLTLESFDRKDSSSWGVGGEVRLIRCFHGRCCNCGSILDTIKQAIPVQCPSLRCPTCGNAERIKCDIQELKLIGAAYKFVIVAACTHCRWITRFTKLLKGIWSVTRIKIGVTGIEIEKSDTSAHEKR